MLSTYHKILLARLAYTAVHGIRRCVGAGDHVIVTRAGIIWELDLGEGIDFSIYALGGFENLTRFVYSRIIQPGDVVLDIGANIGAHTLPFAKLVGPSGLVVAFEPTNYAFCKLERNISLNAELSTQVRLEQTMLVENNLAHPTPYLYSSWPLRSGDYCQHPKHRGVLTDTSDTTTVTLDEYVRRNLQRVDFLKIDVDGNECNILRGATTTLASHQPDILIEFMPHGHDGAGSSFEELVETLTEASYQFFRIPSMTALPQDAHTLRRRIPSGGSINVLCRAHAE